MRRLSLWAREVFGSVSAQIARKAAAEPVLCRMSAPCIRHRSIAIVSILLAAGASDGVQYYPHVSRTLTFKDVIGSTERAKIRSQVACDDQSEIDIATENRRIRYRKQRRTVD